MKHVPPLKHAGEFFQGGTFSVTKKQLKLCICVLQSVCLGLLFLPMGRAQQGGGYLNSFELMRRYAALGFSPDAQVYAFLSLLLPMLTAVFLFTLRERKNFGVGACLCAFNVVTGACFYSAVKTAFSGSVTMTGLHYLLEFLLLASLIVEIYSYLNCEPPARRKS